MTSRSIMVGVAAALLLSTPFTASATTIATADPGLVGAFQAGASIITFEGIGGITALNNQTVGFPVPPAAQLKSQITGLTFFSNDMGGPAVLDLTGFANLSDAKSPPNVLAGTMPGDGAEICFVCFIEVTFTSPVSKVGAWNDPTGSRIQLLATDLGGGTIFESVFADQGQFVGADTGTNNIQRALFQFITTQGVNGFTLDDLTFAQAGAVGQVPLPATAGLVAIGLTALALIQRRRLAARD